jgi:hypothetical protein
MFVLVILSCLNTGGDCYPAPAYQDLRQFECMMGAPKMLPEWKAQHPKRSIVRFTCVAEDRLKMFLNGSEA